MLFVHNKKAFKDHQPSETMIGHYARFTFDSWLLLVAWQPSKQENKGAIFFLTRLLVFSSVFLSCQKQIVPFSSKMLTFIYAIPALKMSFAVSVQLALDKTVVYSFNPPPSSSPSACDLSQDFLLCNQHFKEVTLCGYTVAFIIANQTQLEDINKIMYRSGRQPTFQQVSRAVCSGWVGR